jgi:hypothetical protein
MSSEGRSANGSTDEEPPSDEENLRLAVDDVTFGRTGRLRENEASECAEHRILLRVGRALGLRSGKLRYSSH